MKVFYLLAAATASEQLRGSTALDQSSRTSHAEQHAGKTKSHPSHRHVVLDADAFVPADTAQESPQHSHEDEKLLRSEPFAHGRNMMKTSTSQHHHKQTRLSPAAAKRKHSLQQHRVGHSGRNHHQHKKPSQHGAHLAAKLHLLQITKSRGAHTSSSGSDPEPFATKAKEVADAIIDNKTSDSDDDVDAAVDAQMTNLEGTFAEGHLTTDGVTTITPAIKTVAKAAVADAGDAAADKDTIKAAIEQQAQAIFDADAGRGGMPPDFDVSINKICTEMETVEACQTECTEAWTHCMAVKEDAQKDMPVGQVVNAGQAAEAGAEASAEEVCGAAGVTTRSQECYCKAKAYKDNAACTEPPKGHLFDFIEMFYKGMEPGGAEGFKVVAAMCTSHTFPADMKLENMECSAATTAAPAGEGEGGTNMAMIGGIVAVVVLLGGVGGFVMMHQKPAEG
ncbi:unnamed protein product [Amoebophrya sp. A120]|nr:unnamed protein product [Amoebophrya sp. A120]|eukprot:GSA120T00016833001.1